MSATFRKTMVEVSPIFGKEVQEVSMSRSDRSYPGQQDRCRIQERCCRSRPQEVDSGNRRGCSSQADWHTERKIIANVERCIQ